MFPNMVRLAFVLLREATRLLPWILSTTALFCKHFSLCNCNTWGIRCEKYGFDRTVQWTTWQGKASLFLHEYFQVTNFTIQWYSLGSTFPGLDRPKHFAVEELEVWSECCSCPTSPKNRKSTLWRKGVICRPVEFIEQSLGITVKSTPISGTQQHFVKIFQQMLTLLFIQFLCSTLSIPSAYDNHVLSSTISQQSIEIINC
jgi:hypothetical protein